LSDDRIRCEHVEAMREARDHPVVDERRVDNKVADPCDINS
jgi:hypothetical protein